MAEEAIKQRINRAVKAVSAILKAADYEIRILDGKPFHIEAIREKEAIRNIRVTVDEIGEGEVVLVDDFGLPNSCTKEIWCRKGGQKSFKIMKVF